MPERSVRHDSFVIEQTYPATPSRVFAAWADADARDIWMDDPDYKSDGSTYELDFRAAMSGSAASTRRAGPTGTTR